MSDFESGHVNGAEGFRVYGGAAYFGHDRLRAARISTFEALSDIWARDAVGVFCRTTRMRGVDVATFRTLNAIYARDARHAYAHAAKIIEADAPSFEAFGTGTWHDEWGPAPGFFRQGYAADARAVWHCTLKFRRPVELRGADRRSFRMLKFGYGRDSNSVFFERMKLGRAEAATFEQLSPAFSCDRRRVYHYEHEIADADRRTFEPLGGSVARDATHVFLGNAVIEGADPDSFTVLGGDDIGRDAMQVYVHGLPLVGADCATFVHESGHWYRDASHVYFRGNRIDDADSATFRVVSNDEAEDRFGRLRNGIRLLD